MIGTGMALGVDGVWSVDQLFSHLKVIVAKHQAIFDKGFRVGLNGSFEVSGEVQGEEQGEAEWVEIE